MTSTRFAISRSALFLPYALTRVVMFFLASGRLMARITGLRGLRRNLKMLWGQHMHQRHQHTHATVRAACMWVEQRPCRAALKRHKRGAGISHWETAASYPAIGNSNPPAPDGGVLRHDGPGKGVCPSRRGGRLGGATTSAADGTMGRATSSAKRHKLCRGQAGQSGRQAQGEAGDTQGTHLGNHRCT